MICVFRPNGPTLTFRPLKTRLGIGQVMIAAGQMMPCTEDTALSSKHVDTPLSNDLNKWVHRFQYTEGGWGRCCATVPRCGLDDRRTKNSGDVPHFNPGHGPGGYGDRLLHGVVALPPRLNRVEASGQSCDSTLTSPSPKVSEECSKRVLWWWLCLPPCWQEKQCLPRASIIAPARTQTLAHGHGCTVTM